jgi:hypothetical protein
MRSLPNGHIQETVGCANAAKSRRYSRVKVVPFQAEGFPTRPHPATLIGRRILKARLSLQVSKAVLWIRDSLNPDPNPAFQVNPDPVPGF